MKLYLKTFAFILCYFVIFFSLMFQAGNINSKELLNICKRTSQMKKIVCPSCQNNVIKIFYDEKDNFLTSKIICTKCNFVKEKQIDKQKLVKLSKKFDDIHYIF